LSTNYYLHAPACPHCGTETEKPRHLGKSSAGWCFALHVYPEEDLHNWKDIWNHIDWLVNEADCEIKDEYSRAIHPAMFFGIVWDRSNDFRRHELDDRCIGHGNGPFDYIIGDFS
jgi:hypothetical protein